MALLLSMLILVMISFVGLASLETVTSDRQQAGYRKRRVEALEAADAGVATAMGTLRRDVGAIRGGGANSMNSYDPGFPTVQLGDGSSYPYGRPSFRPDPDAAAALDYVGRGDPCPWLISLEERVRWDKTLWDVRIEGSSSDGTTAQIEVVAGICRPFNVNY